MKKKQKNKIKNIQIEKTNMMMYKLETIVLRISLNREETHLKLKDRLKLSRNNKLIIKITKNKKINNNKFIKHKKM